MNAPYIWRIAARQSDLARLQAYAVGQALLGAAGSRGDKIEYHFRSSLGDQNQHDPLWKMPAKGVFTEDFQSGLVSGEFDMVVHSWKDLPTEERAETEIVATLRRADQRDLFLFRLDREGEFRGGERRELRVLTSSPRRAHNLEGFFREYLPFGIEQVKFCNVRGNMLTRLKKLFLPNDDGLEVDGLVVAKAAIDRLLNAEEVNAEADEFAPQRQEIRALLKLVKFMVLPLSVNPTAAAQGALAVEVKRQGSSDETRQTDMRKLLKQINVQRDFTAVENERAVLASFGGGCHQKIGVSDLPRDYGRVRFLRGKTTAGTILNEISLLANDARPPRAKSPAEVFPARERTAPIFCRETLSPDLWRQGQSEKYLWISRETALPKGFVVRDDAILWCAGIESWRKLARERGLWVHGCADGLGEQESEGIEFLIAEKPDWLKLTHFSANAPSLHRTLATYRLFENDSVEQSVHELSGCTHFFWMSGSSFDWAVARVPKILSGYHFSGPGLTHQHLRSRLGGERVFIALGLQDFHRAVLN